MGKHHGLSGMWVRYRALASIDTIVSSLAFVPANRASISALDIDSAETCLGVRIFDSVVGCDPEGTMPDKRSTFLKLPANRSSISALAEDSEETRLGVRFGDSAIGVDPEGTLPGKRPPFSESEPAPAEAGLG